jgi:multiple sugar transport system substrate-binding protein
MALVRLDDKRSGYAMASVSRRALLRRAAGAGLLALGGSVTGACRTRVVEVEKLVPVDRPVTKIVTEVVRETVVVPELPVAEHLVTPRPSPTPDATPTPAPIASVTLRADLLNYGWTRFAQQMAPAFQETFPYITIQWRSLSDWREYPERLAVLRAAGDLGDIVESPSATLTAAWVADGLLADLAPAIEADGYDTSGLLPGSLAAYRYEERQFGLPYVAHGAEHVLLYDQDMLDEADLAYPDDRWSLEELLAVAEEVAAAGAAPYGQIVSARLPAALPLLRAFGGDLLDPSGQRCTAADPEAQGFLRWLHRQVCVVGAAPGPAAIERGPTAMWRAGRVAMLLTSLREAVALVDLQPGRRIGIVPLPAMAGSDTAPGVAAGVGYGVPAVSAHAPETLQWIKFMLTREMGVRLFVEGFAEPGSRMAAWQDPRVLDRFPYCARLAEVVARSERERVPANLATEECYRLWNEQMARMLAGALSPEETAGRIAAEVDEAIGAVGAPAEEGS